MAELKNQSTVFRKFVEEYKSGRMSVLVGAGMSKNISNSYLLWGNLMYDAVACLQEDLLCNIKCEEERNTHVKMVLKNADFLQIASDYIQKFGCHEAIDDYIAKRTPLLKYKDEKILMYLDKEIVETFSTEQMNVHTELLRCKSFNNWFTTNYDNALEIASIIISQNEPTNHCIVKKCEDLSNHPKNCIIKVHGSIRENDDEEYGFDHDNHLQFIIAKEDYEEYHEKHDAFSNLMKVSMLQGIFCLVGFSGTDPNYKKWLDWTTDILQNVTEKQTKIFVIDIDGYTIPNYQQLYNTNHHIEVLNLWEEEVLRALFPEESKDSEKESFASRLKNHKVGFCELLAIHKIITNNDNNNAYEVNVHSTHILAKREILRRLFAHLSNVVIADDFNTHPKATYDSEDNREKNSFISQSFDYQEAWDNVAQSFWGSSKTLAMKSNHDRVSSNRLYRFAKYIGRQDQAIDFMINMKSLSKDAASLFAMAVTDVGLLPKFYSKIFPNDTELNKDPQWRKLLEREKTLNGCTDYIETNDDYDEYENIQRSLLNLDFNLNYS